MAQRVVILGAGESGTGAALLAQARGYDTFVSDRGMLGEGFQAELDAAGIAYEAGGHTESSILNADLVVKSPGIPDSAPLVQALVAQGTEVISEIEFAYRERHDDARLVLVTGTNGKTTTTRLIHHLLLADGKNAALGGNVGHSFARLVLQGGFDFYVLEVSSFQLDGMYSVKADVAVLLNISPDHLDRYNYDMQAYTDSKFRILQNMTESDAFVYYGDDPIIRKELELRQPTVQRMAVTLREADDTHGSLMGDTLVVRSEDRLCDWYYPTEQISLQGPHNHINAMVAALAAKRMGAHEETIRKAFGTFENAPHRMETITEVEGVLYVNDSKATNVDSVRYALGTFETQPIVWVAGGIDKGNDYSLLEPLVRERVRAVVCLGKDNAKLLGFARKCEKPAKATTDTAEAVAMAHEFAHRGDVVLLSPACSSFDLYRNYEQRGDFFREAVLAFGHQLWEKMNTPKGAKT